MRQHYPVLLPFLALENLVLKYGAEQKRTLIGFAGLISVLTFAETL